MWIYLLQGLGYGFAAAVQPGPLLAYLISLTLSQGWKRAFPAVFAPLLSDGPILLVCLLVLTQVPAWLQRGLSLAGGCFILYLAWGAFQSWRNFDEKMPAPASANTRGLLKAAFMNLLNPNPYIYWTLVTGPILLRGWSESPQHGLAFLGSFYAVMILCLAGLILLFGTAGRLGPRVNRALLGVSALALLGFGLYQLGMGIAGR